MSVWERAQPIFLAALDIPQAERAAYLDRVCAGDPALRQEVESLLAHDTSETQLGVVFKSAAATLIEQGSLIGKRVGAYQIQSELGHGGMGAVYLAVRADDEFHKAVAIKVVKRGMDTKAMLERFRYERQILANLDHPYIARLMDGGSTADHQPFFVMEYVEGRTIDRFCRESQPGVKAICRLFLRVCEAVAYAHRNLVVHRDLKPGNIIVTSDGAPKLLDFGVAKLLTIDSDPDATVTSIFQRPLTPEYASPEQFRGLPVSTATDVYSLGAVLYELLTGARIHKFSSNAAAEWERVVCDTEIVRPGLLRRELRGDLDNILLMALRKEPERRYSSVEQFAGDIQRYLDGRPVAARQDSFRYRAGKYVRRHRVIFAAAGLVAASVVSGVIVVVSEARDARAARVVAVEERTRAEERSRQADAARVVAEREHGIAEQQASVAKSEQARAEQRLTQMMELANKTLFDVHAAIERLPGATDARRQIVKATLDYLESLEKGAGNDSNDPRLRFALGAAYLRIGEVQGSPDSASMGDTVAAAKSLDRAALWVGPLRSRRPPDPNALAAWIDIRRARAQILLAVGKPDEARVMLTGLLPDAALLSKLSPDDGREANLHQILVSALQAEHPAEAIEHARLSVESFSKLVARYPDNKDDVLAISAVHSLWAAILRPTDPPAALGHLRESARLREQLIAKYPNDSAVRRGLMLVYGQIASALGDSFQLTSGNDVEGARVYYEKAAVIARDLAQADPLNRLGRYDLGSVNLRLGALDPRPGAEAESLRSLELARTIFEGLIKDDPQTIRYASSLALAEEYIGHRLRDAGKTTEALAEYKRSVEFAEKALALNAKDLSAIGQASVSEEAIAALLAAGADRAGALDYAARSVERAERIRAIIATPITQIRLARAYEAMAGVRRKLGDWSEARAAAVRASTEWRGVSGSAHAVDLARAEQLVLDCDQHVTAP